MADSNEVWVRVWFGSSVVNHYRAERDLAMRYLHEVKDHFRGLEFTVHPLPDGPGAASAPVAG